jgi:hypothetical protein
MMDFFSFPAWVQLGLLATFVTLVMSLLFGFYLRSSAKMRGSLSHLDGASRKVGFFGRETRGVDRVPCDLPLELLDRSEYMKTGSGRLLNISTNGACFASKVILTLGERIQGRVWSPKEGKIKISGDIVWVRPGGDRGILYGIRFNSLVR